MLFRSLLEQEKKYEIKKQNKQNNKPYKIIIKKNSAVKWLVLVMIICAFTGLLTPLGDTPYTYLIKTMQGNTTQNINEHLPMTLVEHEYIFCLIIAYLAI